MSAQILNQRSTNRIENAVGFPILRAWGHGSYVFGFVTPDHRHGSYNSKTGEWHFKEDPFHYTSCHELFPEWKPEPVKEFSPGLSPDPEITVTVKADELDETWIVAKDAR